MSGPLDAPERPEGAPRRRPSPPATGDPGRRRFVAAAAGAGLLAALALPGEKPGLGVPLVAVALAGAAWVGRGGAATGDAPAGARRRAHGAERPSPGRAAPRADPWPRVWAALAVALASIALLRDAQWVVWPAMLGAVALGSVAVAGRVTWRAPFAALLAWPRGAAAVARAAGRLVPQASGARAVPVLRGTAIAAILVAVFGALFATGDRAFAQLAEDSLPEDVALGLLPWRLVAFAAVAAFAGALVVARPVRAPSAPARRLRTAEWAIPLAALDTLFAAFVVVQLAVLFGGDERVLETAGLTYAEYAREGYGQLLVAAALTLAVAGGALRWADGDRRLLRGLLALLCLLTGVVLASALHRLDLYQDAFGATRLRVTATATLLWLAALLALTLASLAAGRHAFLPRASLLVTALAGLAFALWNPDLRIAERNMRSAEPDRGYLATLSADAAPALPPSLRARRAPDGWGGFNLARR